MNSLIGIPFQRGDEIPYLQFHVHYHFHVLGDTPSEWNIVAVWDSTLSTIAALTGSMYNARSLNPFDAYPVSNTLCILALVVCFCATLVPKIYPGLTISIRRIVAFVTYFSGSIGLVLLISVPLRDKFVGLAYLSGGFLFVVLMFWSLRKLLEWVRWVRLISVPTWIQCGALEALFGALDILVTHRTSSTIILPYPLPV